jgi:ABC-type transporter MlaC component
MKKIAIILVIIVLVIAAGVARYKYLSNKYSDINYAAQRYITTGLFNKYKLYKVDELKISFSDGNLAIMSVSGMLEKSPHNNVNYKILLEKNKNGLWKVKNVYPE